MKKFVKKKKDSEALEETTKLKEQVKKSDSVCKQGFLNDAKKIFEPITKAVTITCSKTFDNCNFTTKANEELKI